MSKRHRSHSTEFKRQVVAEYHAGETLHALGVEPQQVVPIQNQPADWWL